MNNQEAKFILSAYRPGGEDAAGTQFAEALEQVSRDPGLASWFADQRAFDQVNSEALCSILVPADLRGNILAGVKISQRRFWPKRPVLLAIAAAIMLLTTVTVVWTRQSRLETWQQDALASIRTLEAGQSKFDHEASDGRALQEWLVAQHSPSVGAMPDALEALPALGCKTISADGIPVSITCFRLRGGATVHLVVRDAPVSNDAPSTQPRFTKANGWMIATWSDRGRTCMLATEATERELRQLFATATQVISGRLALLVRSGLWRQEHCSSI
ncbi:MAG TPA: hypothetical protein VGM65_01500 [Candidatus Udaeobacter sp.]